MRLRSAAAARRPNVKHEDPARLDALGNARRDRLDQRGRLAGAGTTDDEQRPVAVRDHGQLGLVSAGGASDRTPRAARAVAWAAGSAGRAGPGHPLFGHHCHTAMQPRAADIRPHRHGFAGDDLRSVTD